MTKTYRAILLHDKDNVATALEPLPEGAVVSFPNRSISVTLRSAILFGHKFSILNLHENQIIYKYGVPIGRLTRSVQAGEHVHLHNLTTLQKKGAAL